MYFGVLKSSYDIGRMAKAAISSTDDGIATFIASFQRLEKKISLSLALQLMADGKGRGEAMDRGFFKVTQGIGTLFF
jgi:hypothetical protein